MDNVLNFIEFDDEHSAHIVQEVICVKCLHRWTAVRPKKVWLRKVECKGCGCQGYVIGTGQALTLDSEDEE